MSHWQQAWNIIAVGEAFSLCSSDDVETVIHNVEQMMNLLVEDDSSEENPSLTVTFFLENEVVVYCAFLCFEIFHASTNGLDELVVFFFISHVKRVLKATNLMLYCILLKLCVKNLLL